MDNAIAITGGAYRCWCHFSGGRETQAGHKRLRPRKAMASIEGSPRHLSLIRKDTGENMNTLLTTPEIDSLKAKLKATWMSGDYDLFSRYMEQDARVFYEQLDVPARCQLLDVACGSGQVALLAAHDGVFVTGVDIAPNLVLRAQARADAEGLNAGFL